MSVAGYLCEAIDIENDGKGIEEFITSGICVLAHQHRENTIALGVQTLTSIVNTFIGTCLRSHCKDNNRLEWVRSGLYGAKQELLAKYEVPNSFEKYVLNMKLPTEGDLTHIVSFWPTFGEVAHPLQPFYSMTDRLLPCMEISMKVYWNEERNIAGGKAPYAIMEAAHYGAGEEVPFLQRLEKLESTLNVSVRKSDEMNMKLRFKNILRRFLRFKFRVYYIVKTFEEVCEITFVNQMYHTASEHWQTQLDSKTLAGGSAD
jgi:hypothetical protein